MRPSGRIQDVARATYARLPAAVQRSIAKSRRKVHERVDLSTLARLSVVMPVYNVEGYLAEAVLSVLSQSYQNLELILVDDGSTDTSGEMCDEFAQQDKRVRVIHKRNAGLGAARNTGIAAARGKYLAFIDSDDYVLPDAYATMIKAMRRSGSDLATGNVLRQQGKREYQAWNQSRSHLVDQLGISFADNPDLIFDTVAWNKVFKRRFFDRQVKSFPVDKLYEDIVPIFMALMMANSVDVIARPVYVWRLRDEGDSITQRLLEPRNIGDRFEMIDTVDALIREHELSYAVAQRFALKIIEGDLWIYVREMSGAPQESVDLIERLVKYYWPKASEQIVGIIPAERRVAFWLLDQGRAADVALFRRWYASVYVAPPLISADGRLLLDTAQCPVTLEDVPPHVLDMGSAAEGIANVTGVRWSGPNTLTITGYAYTKYVSTGAQTIELVATSRKGGNPVVLPVERTSSLDDSARWAADTASRHDQDGFACDIDVQALRSSAFAGADDWSFAARVTDTDIVRTIELRKIWKGGSAAVVGSVVLADRTIAMANTDSGRPLRLLFERADVLATAFEVSGDQVKLRLDDVDAGVSRITFANRGETDNVEATRHSNGWFVAQLPKPDDPAVTTTWRVLALIGGKRVAVHAPAGFDSTTAPNVFGLRAVVTRQGRATVQGHVQSAVVDKITCTSDGDIEVGGSLFALETLELGIGPVTGPPDSWYRVQVEGGRFHLSLPPARIDFAGVARPLRAGAYRLYGRASGAPDSEVEVILDDDAATAMPDVHLTPQAKIKFVRRKWARVGVDVAAPVPERLLGRVGQSRLIERYSASPRALEDSVFFCVDLGANAADSALAIHDELRRRGMPLTLYWGVEDLSVPVPEGGIAIVKNSPDWFEKLNNSRYIVNNYGGIWGLTKDPAQRYLQTWHGTPYKFVGAAEARHRNASNARLDQIAQEAADWDAFVSPSPYFTDLLPNDFFYRGRVLETGYPRNDRLRNATDGERRALREALGIPDGAKTILYAPTFREGLRNGTRAALFDGLDMATLLDLLGPDWFVLLRGHSYNARDNHNDRSADQVLDATRHPDVNDLYIAADVLVTDYSSVMFDFAVTGKPMAFFTPDMKRYVATRGVYFDLAQAAPGPLYDDVRHLADGLKRLDTVEADYRHRYHIFQNRFTPWDDGKAAARVVDDFFD